MATLCRPAMRRIACAVVVAELRRLRDGEPPPPPPGGWPDNTPLGESGLGLDSLERLGALGALAEAFGLDDAPSGREPPATVGDWIDWIALRHAGGDGRMTVRTSGSTGTARPCVHDVAALLDEASVLAARFAGRRRAVALVPADHLYGIVWTALLPAALGVPVVTRATGEPLSLAAGDLVVAVPDQWRAALRQVRGFPGDVVGVSSAGPLDDALGAALLAAGLSRLVDVYGSSETGGIGMRDLPARGYELFPRWRLLPDGAGDWQLADRAGRCRELPDHVERIGERALRPVGRRDGAVQVAGHNVWPERVARVLREVEGVAEAAVRLHDGGRLKAFIVPGAGRDDDRLRPRIERAIALRLSEPERPRSLRFGAELPRNAMGKLRDWA